MTRPAAPHARTKPHPQSGSVIVWILVCIAMFAALGFAVSNMMRSGGTGVNEELSRVTASDIMAYSDGVRRAVQSLRASGITLGEISFEQTGSATYQNPSCTSDSCRVFRGAGGGMSYMKPDAKWLDGGNTGETHYGEWFFAADTCVPNIGTGGPDCLDNAPATNDLTMILPYVSKALCIEINKQLGITPPLADPPQNDSCPWNSTTVNRYTGSFTTGGKIESGTAFHGRQSGCFQMGSCGSLPTGSYHFYQVIAPR